MKNTILAFSLLLSAQIVSAADLPAPGYRDIASTEIHDIAVTISRENGHTPSISFRTEGERFIFTPAIFATGPSSNASTAAAASSLVELLRQANYISIKAINTNTKDPTNLPIFEITDVGFHLKK